jgi:hypothetical protein
MCSVLTAAASGKGMIPRYKKSNTLPITISYYLLKASSHVYNHWGKSPSPFPSSRNLDYSRIKEAIADFTHSLRYLKCS